MRGTQTSTFSPVEVSGTTGARLSSITSEFIQPQLRRSRASAKSAATSKSVMKLFAGRKTTPLLPDWSL